eukprot:COSAG02_NODE_50161_length_322_cov_0.874439_1_plen_43_part_01
MIRSIPILAKSSARHPSSAQRQAEEPPLQPELSRIWAITITIT